MTDEEQVLATIRKIMRQTDLYSRKLNKTVGLTTPQLLLLKAIKAQGEVSISRLSSEVSLSQATVTTIIDRLEARRLVRRKRSSTDKRVVHAVLTPAGEKVLETAPVPLQDVFTSRFGALADWEKSMIVASLQRVAAMMDAEEIDASPMLYVGGADDLAGTH